MNARIPNYQAAQATSGRSLILWLLAAGCLLLTVLGLLRQRSRDNTVTLQGPAPAARPAASESPSNAARDRLFAQVFQRRSGVEPAPTAEQVVSNKVAQFASSRRQLAQAIAKKFNVEVSPEIQQFFAAAEAGNWEVLQSMFEEFKARRQSGEDNEALRKIWPAMFETFCVAQVARDWPAQQLLDYGQSVLGALRPGMVYVGGTDAGRYIPTLLNETSGDDPHIILTQNALADGSYLEYLGFLYGDRMATLTSEESQRSFQSYISDAQRRFIHDRDFPDEPRQLRPGEDIRMDGNRIQVSGQVAVMGVNERLLQTLLAKNPELSFAMEESFPFKSTYGAASPLGPLMELRTPEEQNSLTVERAAQSIEYWRTAAQRFATESEAWDSNARKAWAQMATAQGNLFAGRQYSAEAEQTYRLARDIAPGLLEPVGGLARLLVDTGRAAEASRILDEFARANSGQRGAVEAFRRTLHAGSAGQAGRTL